MNGTRPRISRPRRRIRSQQSKGPARSVRHLRVILATLGRLVKTGRSPALGNLTRLGSRGTMASGHPEACGQPESDADMSWELLGRVSVAGFG